MKRTDFPDIVSQSIKRLDGCATIVAIAQDIWANHETDLQASGDLFYTWQYDMRWAAQRLRDSGKLVYVRKDSKQHWQLV
jgi:hypothetical protein